MSATLDAEPVARFLGDCPRARSEGRLFEIAIEYQQDRDDRPVEQQVALLAVSVLHGCEYCTMGHTYLARSNKLDRDQKKHLRYKALRGIEMAARTYFDKPAAQLDTAADVASAAALMIEQLAPDDAFVVSPVPHWPRGPLVVPMSLKTLCGLMADVVNAHNRQFAQPNLRKVRAYIEELKEKGRVTPSTLAWLEENGLYDVTKDHVTTLGLLHPPRADARRFALLSAFEAGYPGLSSRGHYVAVQPQRIRSRFVGEGDS